MGKIFGIDLGTTYSCIAYVDDYGKETVVPNEENSPVTPSVVYFESESCTPVGDVAKENLSLNPEFVCSAVKRQMGKEDWFFEAHGVEYRAETISALILKKLAKDASAQLGEEVKDVVITCPAYFGIGEREATKNAGDIAGLNVLAVINEPTAAALSYGLNSNNAETVLIYDLGGGTFDVTIIQVDPGKSINVVATGGDHNLGGKDWDADIREYLVNKFIEETGATDDLYDDPETLGDLELKSESLKKSLSKMNTTSSRIVFAGLQAKIEMTRDTFDSITNGRLENTIQKTHEMIAEAAKKGVTSYDKILMVGGSTRMPQVEERLRREFPNVQIDMFDPDQSVAKGAAIYGMNIAAYNIIEEGENGTATLDGATAPIGGGFTLPGGASKPMEIINVLSKSFGVEMAIDEAGTTKVVNIVFRNDSLPVDITINAGTFSANQTEIPIKVYENEVSDKIVEYEISKILGEKPITGLPEGLPAGSPVDITFKISEEGKLEVEVLEVTGNNKIELDFDIKGAMTQEQREEAIRAINALTVM